MSKIPDIIFKNKVIAAVASVEKFKEAVADSNISCIMLKFGNIDNISELVEVAHKNNKKIIVHLDAIKGIAKDPHGIKYLAKIGVDCMNTTKPNLISTIREAGMVAIQVMFLVDQEALKAGIESINRNKPDGVIIMPMSIPEKIIKDILEKTKVDLIAGGLLTEKNEISECLNKGFSAVVTSQKNLWKN